MTGYFHPPLSAVVKTLMLERRTVVMGKWSRLSLLSLGAGYDRYVPIYHSVVRGRSVPLLKTLVSSYCTNNCAYCAFRCERRAYRERFRPAELADIALKLWKRGSIQGVFLSSSVERDPDGATRAELETAEIMRERGYTGYLHLRLMPSCGRELVRRAAELGDRIGLNIENPDSSCLAEIRPGIDARLDIWRRLRWCREEADRRASFVRAGLDTQFVVGASDETDEQILGATHKLVAELSLRRVYYSGFSPIKRTPLEDRAPCPKVRELRLYQASFLMRDYGFKPEDFHPALDDRGFLCDVDPKLALAQTRPELFPIDLNSAGLKELLLVPGIGPRTAERVLAVRGRASFKSLSDAWRRVGARIRTAAPYLSVGRERQRRLDDFIHPA